MIHNKSMKSTEFKVLQNFVVVAPQALETGELKDGEIIIDMEQNNSIIHRPTTGTVLSCGPDVTMVEVENTILWVEQDGMEMEFEDGIFLIIKETSILGYKG